MGKLSAKLRSMGGPEGHHAIGHWCPGCDSCHVIYYERPPGSAGPIWTWDRNVDAPTMSPSVRITHRRHTEEDGTVEVEAECCHYFLKAGKIEFCGDCTHHLNGQTVDMPDWPYAEGEYGGA